MIGLLFASILAGFIAGAPFGAAGALVADAALIHNRRRIGATIMAAAAGDSILAFIVSFASIPIRDLFTEYEGFFFIIAGAVIFLLGITLWIFAMHSSLVSIGGAAGPVSVFFIALLHPGSIATFLLITALFSMHFPAFNNHRLFFASGIAIGSLCAFSPVGVLFWVLSRKAEKYIRHFRCGLAAMLLFVGLYLISKGF